MSRMLIYLLAEGPNLFQQTKQQSRLRLWRLCSGNYDDLVNGHRSCDSPCIIGGLSKCFEFRATEPRNLIQISIGPASGTQKTYGNTHGILLCAVCTLFGRALGKGTLVCTIFL